MSSGKGRGRRVPAARAGRRTPSRAGRRAWPARPASWGLGSRRRCRRSGGTPSPPSRRPAPSRAQGLCHCTCPGAQWAVVVRPGRAPRLAVICPGRGLAPGASGSPQAPPGRPSAPGLTCLGYGAGGVGAGSLRGPSGALPAGWGGGGRRPLGNLGRRPRRGADVSTRPAPFDPALGAEWHSLPAQHGWCEAAAATSFPPGRLGSPTERCPPRPVVAPASSQPLSVPRPGGGLRGGLRKLFQVRRASGCNLSTSPGRTRS